MRSSASSPSWSSTVHPNASQNAARLRPLDREALGHRRAVGVVGGVGLGAVVGGLGAEAVHDRARLVLLDHLEHRVGRAEQRVDGLAVRPRDRVGEREERSVEQVGGVGDEEWAGHDSATYTRMTTITGLAELNELRGQGPRHERLARGHPEGHRPVRRRDRRPPVDPRGPRAREGRRRSAARSPTATTRCRWRPASRSRSSSSRASPSRSTTGSTRSASPPRCRSAARCA